MSNRGRKTDSPSTRIRHGERLVNSVLILQHVNSSIWIAIKETGSDIKWMNSPTDSEERIFKSIEASGGGNCYLLEVGNPTSSSNDENAPVNVVRRNCSQDFATDMALCMKCM